MSIQKTNTALTANSNSTASFDNSMIYTSIQAGEALKKLNQFIGSQQRYAINALCQGEERQFFYAALVNMANIVEAMPVTYETNDQGDQATVHLHYFTATADFYITERDCMDEQLQAFGKADLFSDGGEIGYINIIEILRFGAELDLHWQPKKLAEI